MHSPSTEFREIEFRPSSDLWWLPYRQLSVLFFPRPRDGLDWAGRDPNWEPCASRRALGLHRWDVSASDVGGQGVVRNSI